MRIPTPKLTTLFTRSPLIESTEEDCIEEGLKLHHAIFADEMYKADPIDDADTDITDPWGRDAALFLNKTHPDQDVDYILLADANIKSTPYDHNAPTSSMNATEIWTRYTKDVAHAYIYLKHLVAAPTAATVPTKFLHSTDTLTSSAIHSILQQLDKTTLEAAQLMRENTVLCATIARYELEHEELEEVNRIMIKAHNAERRLCECAGEDETAYSESVIQRYGEARFVKGRLHSWQGEVCGKDADLGA